MNKYLGALYAFVAAFCFGISAPLIKVAADNIPVFFFQSFVLFTALLILIPIHYLSQNKRAWQIKKYWKEFLLIGILGTVIPASLATFGFAMGYGSNASVMLRTEVFFVLIVGAMFFDERVNLRQILGILFGFLGVVLFITQFQLQFSWADIFVAIAGACFAVQFYVVKIIANNLSPVQINIARFAVALPFFVLASIWFETINFSTVTPYLPHAFVGNTFLIMIVGVNFYFAAVKYWEIWKVAFTAQFGAVLIGAISSIMILGEMFSGWQWLGTLIIVASLFVVLYQPAKKSWIRKFLKI